MECTNTSPSETQLRSRLKKWRVTKPSRQTRKKSQDQQETTGDDSDPDDISSKGHASTASPSIQPSSQQAAKGVSTTADVEWHPVSLEEQDFSTAWVPGHHHHRDLSHSPSEMHQLPSGIPSSSSYDPSQPSTPVDGVLLNPSSTMAPPYSTPPFTVAPDACLPQSSAPAVTSVPWSVPPPWFSMPLDGVSSQPHSVPFYAPAPPLSPPMVGSPDHSIPPSSRIYSPQSVPYPAMLPHGGMSDFMGDSKPWRRARSLQCNSSDTMSGDQRKYMERKASMPAKTSSAYDMVNPSSQFIPNGQHPMMCAPLYPFPDQESLAHKPPGIGF